MGLKKDWIKQNVLYNQRFKSTLDIQCGGFVYYPQKKGEPWSMHALKMAKFLDENFNQMTLISGLVKTTLIAWE